MMPTMITVETHNVGINDEKEGLLMRTLRAGMDREAIFSTAGALVVKIVKGVYIIHSIRHPSPFLLRSPFQ